MSNKSIGWFIGICIAMLISITVLCLFINDYSNIFWASFISGAVLSSIGMVIGHKLDHRMKLVKNTCHNKRGRR